MGIFDIIQKYNGDLLRGLRVTLALCAIVWSVGIVGGVMVGVCAARWKVVVGLPAKGIAMTLAGIPTLVFLFWMHYPLQSVLGVVIDPFVTAAASLSIINVFMVADLWRGTLSDFPEQYVWAAQVCGLTPRETLVRIKLPILLRQVLPGLLLIQISMLQATLFSSLISVNEIFRVAQRINAQIYRPVEIYSALAVMFVIVCVPIYALAYYLRARFTRDLSER